MDCSTLYFADCRTTSYKHTPKSCTLLLAKPHFHLAQELRAVSILSLLSPDFFNNLVLSDQRWGPRHHGRQCIESVAVWTKESWRLTIETDPAFGAQIQFFKAVTARCWSTIVYWQFQNSTTGGNVFNFLNVAVVGRLAFRTGAFEDLRYALKWFERQDTHDRWVLRGTLPLLKKDSIISRLPTVFLTSILVTTANWIIHTGMFEFWLLSLEETYHPLRSHQSTSKVVQFYVFLRTRNRQLNSPSLSRAILKSARFACGVYQMAVMPDAVLPSNVEINAYL